MPNAEEDFANYHNSIDHALKGNQAGIQTSLPGIIVDFNPITQTATVQVAIQSVKETDDNPDVTENLNISPLKDVPVEFPSGGGFSMTFPIAKGDECMVNFTSRNIDGWWAKGGVQPPMHPRMHDLSDAVCRVGVRSKGRSVNAKPGVVQLRADDGSTYVEIAAGQIVNIVAPGGLNITAPKVTFSGTVHAQGAIDSAAEITAKSGSGASVTLSQHHGHSGSPTPPTPGT